MLLQWQCENKPYAQYITSITIHKHAKLNIPFPWWGTIETSLSRRSGCGSQWCLQAGPRYPSKVPWSSWRPWRTGEENKSLSLSQASDSVSEGSRSSTQALSGSEVRALFWPRTAHDQLQGNKTELLTELAIFPSLLSNIRWGEPVHLSM